MSISLNKQNKKTEAKEQLFASKKLLIIGSLSLSIIISAAVYFLYISPQLARVGEGREIDIETLTQQLRQKETVLKDLKELRNNFEAVPEKQIKSLSVILPDEKDIPELLNQLETIARASGVNLSSVSITEEKPADTRSARQRLQASPSAPQNGVRGLISLNIQAEITAFEYANFKKFLENIQSNARLMDIQQFKFSSDNNVHSLQIKTYYLPQ